MILGLGLVILLLAYGLLRLSQEPPNPYEGLLEIPGEDFWSEKGKEGAYRPSDPRALTEVWAPLQLEKVRDGEAKRKTIAQRIRKWKKNPQGIRPLEGLTVFLDPGHGGRDTGTLRQEGETHYFEKDVTLELSFQVQALLEKAGAKVQLLRGEDRFLSIYARTALVGKTLLEDFLHENEDAAQRGLEKLSPEHKRELEALYPELDRIVERNSDQFGGILGGYGASEQARLLYTMEAQYPDALFLSIHVNSAQRPEAHGSQAFILRNFSMVRSFNVQAAAEGWGFARRYEEGEGPMAYPLFVSYDDVARTDLAGQLYLSLEQKIPQLESRDLTSIPDFNFAVLRSQNLPSVLLETGYITNEGDRHFLWSGEGQHLLSEAILEGILHYAALRP